MAEMRDSEEGRKGAHIVVVEVGREVTGFVRIFARPMRDASPDRIVVLKNIIERVWDIIQSLACWNLHNSKRINFIKINLLGREYNTYYDNNLWL